MEHEKADLYGKPTDKELSKRKAMLAAAAKIPMSTSEIQGMIAATKLNATKKSLII